MGEQRQDRGEEETDKLELGKTFWSFVLIAVWLYGKWLVLQKECRWAGS